MTSSSPADPGAKEAPAAVGPQTLIPHSILVGLTPLIPVPFLDDVVKRAIERRLVRAIAAAHGRQLTKTEVKELTEEPGGGLWALGKGIALFPFKLIFKTVFVVLEVKNASDEASACYHRGLLLDLVLRSAVLAPDGPKTAMEVRTAVNEVASGSTVSPLGRAVLGVFEGSKAALAGIGRGLLARIGKRGAASKAAVEGAVDETATDGAMATLVARMTAAVADVPAAHFEALERALEAKLGVPLQIQSRSGSGAIR